MIEAGMVAIAFCFATELGGQDGIDALLQAAARRDNEAYTEVMQDPEVPCVDLRMHTGTPVTVMRVLEAKVDEVRGPSHVCYSHLFEDRWRKRYYTFTCLPQPQT